MPLAINRNTLILSLACLAAILAITALSANNKANATLASQTRKHKIVNTPWKQPPVEITEVTVNGQTITSGADFEAGDNFLDQMQIKVKNVSDQPVSYILLEVMVFDDPDHSQEIQHHQYGADPTSGYINANPLQPDSEVVLTASPVREDIQIGSYEKITLSLYQVFFNNDPNIRWSNGLMFERTGEREYKPIKTPPKKVHIETTPAVKFMKAAHMLKNYMPRSLPASVLAGIRFKRPECPELDCGDPTLCTRVAIGDYAGGCSPDIVGRSCQYDYSTSRAAGLTELNKVRPRTTTVACYRRSVTGDKEDCFPRQTRTVVLNNSLCNPTGSPIIINFGGNLELTSAADGVMFDILASGTPVKVAWTRAGGDEAFLALDRNGDGKINDGSELFGDHTTQPPSFHLNGFNALSIFDRREYGGNSDTVIDSRDAVFGSLLLWRDANHNGISEPSELSTLQQNGVESLSLDYKTSYRTDQNGNAYRYRAKVDAERGVRIGSYAWDVFLQVGR